MNARGKWVLGPDHRALFLNTRGIVFSGRERGRALTQSDGNTLTTRSFNRWGMWAFAILLLVCTVFIEAKPAEAGVRSFVGDAGGTYVCGSPAIGMTGVLRLSGNASCLTSSSLLVPSSPETTTIATFYSSVVFSATRTSRVRGNELYVDLTAATPGDVIFELGYGPNTSSFTAIGSVAVAVNWERFSLGHLVDLKSIWGTVPANNLLALRIRKSASAFQGTLYFHNSLLSRVPGGIRGSVYEGAWSIGGTAPDYATIQDALNNANTLAGDYLFVAPGTYRGTGFTNVTVAKNVTLTSEAGADQTIIDCEYRGSGFTVTGNAVLDGLTIARASRNAIKVATGAPTIQNCIVRDSALGSKQDSGKSGVVSNGDSTASGSVRSDGITGSNVLVGDTSNNRGSRGLLSFGIAAIPQDAEILSAALNLSSYAVVGGDPFQLIPGSNFQVLALNFDVINAATYSLSSYATLYNAMPGGAALTNIDASAALMHALAQGYRSFQLRLQFAQATNNDNTQQMVNFSIRDASLTVSYRRGSGVRIVSSSMSPTTIDNCSFHNNSGYTGGALSVENARVVVYDSDFVRNSAATAGGAISVVGPIAYLEVRGSTFYENSSALGGAIYSPDTGTTLVDASRFEGNAATIGGCIASRKVSLSNCVMFENGAKTGGAIYATNIPEDTSWTVLNHCSVFESTADYGQVAYLASNSKITIANSILWNSSEPTASQWVIDGWGGSDIGYSIIKGGAGRGLGGGVTSSVFGPIGEEGPKVAFDGLPYLMPGSPGINGGTSSPNVPPGTTLPTVDFDGNDRAVKACQPGGVPDLGAFEFRGDCGKPVPIVYPPLLNVAFMEGSGGPDELSLRMVDASTTDSSWKASADAEWLHVRPPVEGETRAEAQTSIAVVLGTDGLQPGLYRGTVFVESSDPAHPLILAVRREVRITLRVGATLEVCASGCVYSSIQDAIDDAGEGDAIVIGDGTYSGDRNTNLVTRNRAITIRSRNGRETTRIDCSNAGHGIIVPDGQSQPVTVQGLTVQNCNGRPPDELAGGGIWAGFGTNVSVISCLIQSNGIWDSTSRGGGAFLNGEARISNTIFRGNHAHFGGALYLGAVVGDELGQDPQQGVLLEDSELIENTAWKGGGIYVKSYPLSSVVIRNSDFQSNTAQYGPEGWGGGLFVAIGNAEVANCTFGDNSAWSAGGAVCCEEIKYNPSVTVVNSVFTGNYSTLGKGGGVFGRGRIINSTFRENTAAQGGGIYLWGSETEVINSISLLNTATGGGDDIWPINATAVTNSLVGGNVPSEQREWNITGQNNLYYLDPQFVGEADLRLKATSPVIDKGIPVNWLFSDRRGSIRAVDGGNGSGGLPDGTARFDLGAYEYSHYYGGTGEDEVAKAFQDVTINGAVVATGYEYRIEWKIKDPFPYQMDERIRQAGRYEVRILLVSELGRRVELGTWVIRLGVAPSIPFTFGAEHVGAWRIRVEMASDANQYEVSSPFTIQHKELIRFTLGSVIPAPPDVVEDVKPDVDVADAVYWSTETSKLYAIKPIPVQVTWYQDRDRSLPYLVMGIIQPPEDPQFHVADTPPVELLPGGSRFTSASLLWSDSSAAISSNRFTSQQDGWAVLLFKDTQNPEPARREFFTVVRTLTWDHKGATDVNGAPYNRMLGLHPPVDPLYPVEQPSWPIGVKIDDAEHQPASACGGGYVVIEVAPYDGAGDTRAYDRSTRSGQIFAVNEDNPNTEDDDLIVVWYRRQGEVANGDTGVCWPFKPVRYDPTWPTPSATCPGEPPGSCDRIEIAGSLIGDTRVPVGSGALPPDTFGAWDNMVIYSQPDRSLPGFNPNEEHAMLFPSQGTPYPGAFPLRNDLNRFAAVDWTAVPVRFTSQPYVLLKYRDPVSGEWRFKVFFVTPGTFVYMPEAGNEFNPPYPLNQFVFGPCRVSGRTARNGTWTDAVLYEDDGSNMSAAQALMDKDKKIFSIRGGVTVRTYNFYRLQEGFWFDLDNNGYPDKPAGTCVPLLDALDGNEDGQTPLPITYNVVWPATPTLYVGETLTDAKTQSGETLGLPNIKDQCVVAKLWDEAGVRLFDPLKEWTTSVDLTGVIGTFKTDPPTGTGTDVKFKDLPPQLQGRIAYDDVNKVLKLKGEYLATTGEPLLLLNTLSVRERKGIKDALNVAEGSALLAAIDALKAMGDANLTGKPSIARWEADFKALSAGNVDNTGFVTLAFNNHQDCSAPTMLSVIEVDCPLYRGDLKVVESPNPFEEKLTLRHNGDFGGMPDARYFEWVYLQGYSGIPEGPGTDGENWLPFNPANSSPGPTDGTTKLMPDEQLAYRGLVDITPKGTGQQLLPDRWFAVRYRFADALTYHTGPPPNGPACSMVSPWTAPQLAEGWVKRVMKKINLFDQRVKDFHKTDADTVASMIAQAGRAYEGDVALSDEPEYLKRVGLIELYQTLLNRALALSLDAAPPDPNLRDAVLFAANRLASLHMLLGNEAFADSADPTVGFSTQDGQYGTMATSIFAFENQMDTLLDEELGLLEGRDDGGIRPFYNRLPWNFTIGDGEVAYRQVYNIQDVADSTGAPEPDGEINEYDAKFLYPQGHGDAWGHYLSAIKKLYSLITHDALDAVWVPTVEAILVAQAPVEVDYRDERLFATAAAARARAGAEIVKLTYRRFYDEDPQKQWQGYRDSNPNRAWGLAEWANRAGEGAYIDWAVGNALLPSVSTTTRKIETFPAPAQARYVLGADYARGELEVRVDGALRTSGYSVTLTYDQVQAVYRTQIDFSPVPTASQDVTFQVSLPAEGIKKVDRTTVVDLHEITAQYDAIQSVLDQADVGLNPLGVAKDTVPFDIDPTRVASGETHFEQIYGRALRALNNAAEVFNFANQSSQLLRRQQDGLESFKALVQDREVDFNNRLVEVYGYPYPEDCGPGKLYGTEYCETGPDIYHYMYLDRSPLLDVETPTTTVSPNQLGPEEVSFEVTFKDLQLDNDGTIQARDIKVPFTMDADRRLGIIKPAAWQGKRKAPGNIQLARSDLLQLQGRFLSQVVQYDDLLGQISDQADLLKEQYDLNADEIFILRAGQLTQATLNAFILVQRTIEVGFRTMANLLSLTGRDAAEMLPTVFFAGPGGVGTDPLAPGRGALQLTGDAAAFILNTGADISTLAGTAAQQAKEIASEEMNIQLAARRGEFAAKQQLLACEALIRREAALRLELYTLAESMQQSLSRYRSELAAGERLLAERLRFRKQTAGQIQDYRYTDMTFRIFRNDALQKYRAQFDMAARYAYLAAKAYDYETALLDSSSLAGKAFLAGIVKERSIGTLLNGNPLIGSGLADPLKKLALNFEVLKPQLGFNNPQIETNRFSLRQELFRVRFDEGSSENWRNVLSAARVADLWEIPEFRRFCRPFAAEGIPEPGLVIPFRTTVTSRLNFFGWPLGGGDSYYNPSNFATKVRSVGVWFTNYNNVGLAQTPRVYLIPAGEDVLRSPAGGVEDIRGWHVMDQKLPMPYPINPGELGSNPGWIPSVDTILDEMGQIRRQSSFKAYHDAGYLDRSEMVYDTRLIGRSVWNTKWVLIVPGSSLHNDPDEGLDILIHGPEVAGGSGERTSYGISDIKLFFETYGYSGN